MEEIKITTVDELQSYLKDLSEITDTDGAIAAVTSLLSTDDDTFNLVAPQILDNFVRSLNLPNNKITLVQSFNATGVKSEDLAASFQKIVEAIDTIEEYSQNKKDFVKQFFSAIFNAVADTEGISKRIIRIAVEKINPDVQLPTYAHTDDSGMDVYALDDYEIKPGETKIIPTGIKVQIPNGYEIQVRPKSGLSLKTKMRVANTPGTVDASFRGEIGVIIENIEPSIKDIDYEFDEITHRPIIKAISHGSSCYITKGQKFAQLVLSEVPKIAWYEVSAVNTTERGEGGYGSTGV